MARTPPPIAPGGTPEVNYHRNMNQHLLDQDARVTALESSGAIRSPLKIGAAAFQFDANLAVAKPSLSVGGYVAIGAAVKLWASIPLGVGNVITKVIAYVRGGSGTDILSLKLWDTTLNSVAATQIGATQSTPNPNADKTLTLATTFTIVDGHGYVIEINANGGGSGNALYGADVYFS